jgi:iron(III) transport system ATP-binding protein
MTPALEIRRLRHAFGSTAVLQDLDLDVPAGSITAVLGPSGCGKTTLLRLVAGFDRPTGGTIRLTGQLVTGNGHWVTPEKRNIGYVAQEGSLFPHLTVRRNLEFGLARAERRDPRRVAELMAQVSLERDHLNRFPHQLSGGQQQRVALARTLARRPAVVLLDEPFTALDTGLRAATREAVAATLRTVGMTTVLVTHDQGEALSFADQIAVMIGGRITQVGRATDVYETPVDLETARLIGDTVELAGIVSGDGRHAQTAVGPVVLRSQTRPGPATILLRPEQLKVRTGVGPWQVQSVEYFGHDYLVDVYSTRAGVSLKARAAGAVECVPGQSAEVVAGGLGAAFPQAHSTSRHGALNCQQDRQ